MMMIRIETYILYRSTKNFRWMICQIKLKINRPFLSIEKHAMISNRIEDLKKIFSLFDNLDQLFNQMDFVMYVVKTKKKIYLILIKNDRHYIRAQISSIAK